MKIGTMNKGIGYMTFKEFILFAKEAGAEGIQPFITGGNISPLMTKSERAEIKKFMEEKYGKEEAKGRIYATTDKAKGALKNLADEEGYETFVVPDDVGGRFSVLTAVGLLPIAVCGADIKAMMQGAADARDLYA